MEVVRVRGTTSPSPWPTTTPTTAAASSTSAARGTSSKRRSTGAGSAGTPSAVECLVYSFGEKQPPFCIPCALSASGIRSNAGNRPTLPKKELRRRQKAEARIAEEEEARAATTTTQIDWSLPINGTDPNADPDFPHFEDDDPGAPRPAAPPPPPSAPKPRGGLFGRKKNKAVPF